MAASFFSEAEAIFCQVLMGKKEDTDQSNRADTKIVTLFPHALTSATLSCLRAISWISSVFDSSSCEVKMGDKKWKPSSDAPPAHARDKHVRDVNQKTHLSDPTSCFSILCQSSQSNLKVLVLCVCCVYVNHNCHHYLHLCTYPI